MTDTEMQETDIPDEAEAKQKEAWRRVKIASVAAMVSATITTLFAVAGFFVEEPTGRLATYLDPWLLIDAAILWILAALVRRGSFASAVILVIYWIASMAVSIIEAAGAGLVVNFLFLYYFINGARGARVIRRAAPPKDRGRALPIVLWGVGGTVAVIFGLFFIYGVAIELGFFPSYEVHNAETMPHRQVETLRENGILQPDETVVYFYSAGAFSILEDGNLITNQRVISYYQNDEDGLQVDWTQLTDIASVSIDQKGDEFSDTLMLVYDQEGFSFMLGITTENGGDRRFFERINQVANQNKANSRAD